MLATPAGSFTVFHRYLPAMELLVWGVCGDREKMYVAATSMGIDISFTYDITPTEIISTTIRNIMLIAHKKLFEEVKTEALQMQKAGAYVH